MTHLSSFNQSFNPLDKARQRPAGQSVPPSWRVISNPNVGSVVWARAPFAAIGSNPSRVIAAVHKLLARHFDEGKGLYEPDWNDERVAGESGAQLAYVVSLRRKHYGELTVPAAAER